MSIGGGTNIDVAKFEVKSQGLLNHIYSSMDPIRTKIVLNMDYDMSFY